MDMISPNEWGAAKDYDSWSDTSFIKDKIAIHWGGSGPANYDDGPEREAEILRAYERYHLGKGWRGLAYGYAVGHSGTVYRIRGKNNYGAHSGDADGDGISNNKEIVPVLFIMGKGQLSSAAQWSSFIDLRWWIVDQDWTEDELPVVGHREIQDKRTECPGDENMAVIHNANWDWRPEPDPMTNAEWIADMKERYEFTQSNAVEVAQYQGGSDLAFEMGVNGTPMDGYNMLLIMELADRIE